MATHIEIYRGEFPCIVFEWTWWNLEARRTFITKQTPQPPAWGKSLDDDFHHSIHADKCKKAPDDLKIPRQASSTERWSKKVNKA